MADWWFSGECALRHGGASLALREVGREREAPTSECGAVCHFSNQFTVRFSPFFTFQFSEYYIVSKRAADSV